MEAEHHIQRSIDWIEENLRAEITLEDAAKAAGFSPYHFCRLFSTATGLTVMQFVTQRRLRHAAYEIAQGRRIIEAALDYGFNSASGFTRAFRREFGLSPREYARRTRPLPPGKVVLKEMNHIMIPQKLIDRALTAWNLTENAQPLIHSSGARSENTFIVGQYMLHVRENRAPLALSITIEEQLRNSGLPAPRTLPAADGEPIVQLDGLYFRLTDQLTGCFYPAHAMYENLSRPQAIGEAIAHLHKAMKPLAEAPELNRPNLLENTLNWSLPRTAQVMNLPDSFVRSFAEAFTRLFPLLPCSPIHRNPTPDAFLFADGHLSGYAHFDMTEVNIRLFDLCYAATAILSETLERLPEETVCRWPDILHAILEGYDRIFPLTAEEREAVPYVVCAVQMVCVAFFSSKEQFASLAKVNIEMTRRIIGWLMK